MTEKKLNKEKIVVTTLDLIDEKGGSKDVNFEMIAAKLGCKQAILYDFFDNYDDILIAAINHIVESIDEDRWQEKI